MLNWGGAAVALWNMCRTTWVFCSVLAPEQNVPSICCLTFCGGEGCYNTTLKGKEGEGGGLIWIQSYNMDKLDAFLVTVQPKDQKNEGGGAPVSVEMMDR